MRGASWLIGPSFAKTSAALARISNSASLSRAILVAGSVSRARAKAKRECGHYR